MGNKNMKWQIPHRITRSAGIIVVLFLMAGSAQAQYVVSAKAGTIQFTTGDVFLDDEQVLLSKKDYVQMENGQSLRAERGLAELLLGPDVYLRLGINSQVRMYRNQLNDIQLALDKGSALIEVVEKAKRSQIRIVFAAGLVEIKKKGLYRLDAHTRELRVYGGEAGVAKKNRKAKIKKGKMVRLNDDLESSKFDVGAMDLLHQWAALRSFILFADNPSSRTQQHWTYIDLGWLKNYDYRMSFRSPELYAEWTRNRNARLSAEAILVTAARKAEQEAAAQAIQEELKAKIEQAMRASQPSRRIQ
jgi:hypothetical protein